MALKDITLDRAYFNMTLCLLTFISIIIGGISKLDVMYIAIGFYLIQMCDYCCSNTRTVFYNLDNLDSVKNLLSEYQRWRPIVMFHYRSNDMNKKSFKISKKNKIMAVLEDEEAKKKISIDEISSI